MINYIKIIRYMSGESIEEQIDRIIDNGMMNEDTRLFFKKSNCVTCEDISKLVNVIRYEKWRKDTYCLKFEKKKKQTSRPHSWKKNAIRKIHESRKTTLFCLMQEGKTTNFKSAHNRGH